MCGFTNKGLERMRRAMGISIFEVLELGFMGCGQEVEPLDLSIAFSGDRIEFGKERPARF